MFIIFMFGLWLHLAKSSYGSFVFEATPQNYKKIEMKNTVLASLSTPLTCVNFRWLNFGG